MRSFAFLFVLAFVCSAIFASNVTIRVLDNWNTALYGTPVELLQKSVVAANATADRTGYATMEVQDGEYIARVSRAGYPVFVNVLKVNGKTDVTLTAIQGRSYSVLYGTVYAEGKIPDGLKLYAVRNNVTQSSAKVYGGGSYVLQFLDDGSYTLVPSASEYAGTNVTFSVSGSQTMLLDVNLKKKVEANAGNGTAPEQSALPFVSVVDKGALYAPIKVKVGVGDAGAPNAQVEALAPDGKVSLVADENGIAIINAAREGRYVFTYMGTQSIVEIGTVKKIEAATDSYAQQLAREEEALAAAAAAQKAAQQKQDAANAVVLFGAGIFTLLAVATLAGAYFFMKGKKQAGHAHEGMRGTHAHENAHEGHTHNAEHKHAHAKHGK
ncbi:Carboxypeptidase regulatory-like domain protein [Candidatus Anstonella stagnisolia]|nr:Carboxypeptidase regulatory-like domain protein [Candidatus Anstonella stagnisolia]